MATSLVWHGSAPRPRRTHFAHGCLRGGASVDAGGFARCDTDHTTSQKYLASQKDTPALIPVTLAERQRSAALAPGHLALESSTPAGQVSGVEAGTHQLNEIWAVPRAAADETATGPVAEQKLNERGSETELLFRKQLERHPHFRGRGDWVRARFRRGTLRLSGTLPSFYLKQVAQTVAHRVPSVLRVINRIEVRDLVHCENRLESWNWKPGK